MNAVISILFGIAAAMAVRTLFIAWLGVVPAFRDLQHRSTAAGAAGSTLRRTGKRIDREPPLGRAHFPTRHSGKSTHHHPA
ncbi:MAG: hypothetical protein J7493_02070 [Porphyrobacter sp.]|nr:hypothetical protein [Porphyrobacter sp.]